VLAPLALKAGASSIGVSSLEEGIALRDAGVRAPILILGGLYPLKNFSVAREFNLTPTVSSFEAYAAFKSAAQTAKKPWTFHLKIDTGMGRIGASDEEAKRILTAIAGENRRHLGGVYSHLATADSDMPFALRQLITLREVRAHAQKLGFEDSLFHIANTAAVFSSRDFHLDMVRPGIGLYGASPVKAPAGVKLKPVLSFHTEVVFLKKVRPGTSISYGRTFVTQRESLIATLPVGYADGVPRYLSNKGHVLIRGWRCPMVGRVTMDQIMVDVTDLSAAGLSIKVGESVILIGRQEKEEISADEWAKWAGTISYEIFCGISARVPRKVSNS
jgi:alanine racemase